MASRPRIDSREHLLHLLAEASELEHNLLCCYLYAAFSLKRERDEGLSDEEAAAVSRWRDLIMSVAIEEMAHLAIVANLTVAIGGRPHFNRPNFPVPPGYHPADIVCMLAPFSADTLDHFIFLERPEDEPIPDGEGFEPEVEYEREPAPAAMMPGAYDYETIGAFYRDLGDGFEHLSAQLGEARLFCTHPSQQVGPEVLDLDGISLIDSLDAARAAIQTIVEQGEGAPRLGDRSHFARFRDVKAELQSLVERRSSFEPARSVARNPVMRKPVVDEDERVHIDEPEAWRVLDFANALYNHMLRMLAQAYDRTAGDPPQSALVQAAIGLMGVLAVANDVLTRLPAHRDGEGPNAGMSFAILRSTEPLCSGRGETIALNERLEALARRADDLARRHPALAGQASTLTGIARSLMPGDGRDAQAGAIAEKAFSPASR